MSRHVYLAARFARRGELRVYRAALELRGFVVTSRWLDSTAAIDAHGRAVELDGSRPESDGRAAALAVQDIADITRSDTFVTFTESPPEDALMPASAGRGGRHVELGVALLLCDRAIVVGPREHIFHWHPKVEHYPDWDTALERI